MTKWKDWILPVNKKYWNNFLDSKYIADTKWKWKLLMNFIRYFGFKEKHTADYRHKDSTEWNPALVQEINWACPNLNAFYLNKRSFNSCDCEIKAILINMDSGWLYMSQRSWTLRLIRCQERFQMLEITNHETKNNVLIRNQTEQLRARANKITRENVLRTSFIVVITDSKGACSDGRVHISWTIIWNEESST